MESEAMEIIREMREKKKKKKDMESKISAKQRALNTINRKDGAPSLAEQINFSGKFK